MSEQICECGHAIVDHYDGDGVWAKGCNQPIAMEHKCPCTRTYESLVGEKIPLPNLPEGASHWVTWGGLGHKDAPPESAKYEQAADIEKEKAKIYQRIGELVHKILRELPQETCEAPTAVGVDEPELSLLVIDLGDSCVVKVEKGECVKINVPEWASDVVWHGQAKMVGLPFTELRSAIDGEKPRTRLEQRDNSRSDTVYDFYYNDEYIDLLDVETYTAFSELVGKPLPIWEGGTWTQILFADESLPTAPFNAWRYRR